MKKHLTFLALFTLALCVVLALAACGPGTTGDNCAELGHSFGEPTELTAATCTEAGVAEAVCTRCGEKSKTEIAMTEHKEKTVAGTPATCTSDGTTDKTVCEYCGEVLTAATVIPKGHVMGDTYSVNRPRNNSTGMVRFDCGREGCSYKFDYTLPKLTDTGYIKTQVGEEVTYTLTVEGKAVSFTISNFMFTQITSGLSHYYEVRSYSGNTANLTIPATYEGAPVKSIGEGAFKNNTSLTTITLPEGLENISASAFSGCTALSSISIPTGCKIIDDEAFAGCTSLTAAALPSGLEYIYVKAFYGCSRLSTLNIPSNLYLIGESAFEGCTSLVSATVSERTTLHDTVFKGCTALRTFTLGKEPYGQGQLEGCSALEVLTLANLNTDIGYLFDKDFNYRYDTNADVLPASLKELTVLDCDTFGGLTNVTTIEKVVLNSCRVIDGEAFKNCTSLSTVILPDNIEKIYCGAFDGCTSLVTYEYQSGKYLGNGTNNYLALIGYAEPSTSVAFNVNEGTKTVSLTGDFWSDFTVYNIPVSVKYIQGYPSSSGVNIVYAGTVGEWVTVSQEERLAKFGTVTFRDGKKNTEITSIELLHGTKFIDNAMLSDFSALTSLTLPVSIEYMQSGTFSRTDVKTLYYKGEHEDWYNIQQLNRYTLQHMEHIYFYSEATREFYEPTYIKLVDSTDNCKGFSALEIIILPKSTTFYYANDFDAFEGCDLFYEGTAEEWARVSNGAAIQNKFNVYFYSEAEQTLEGYLATPEKLWHYSEGGVPKAWVKLDNNVNNRTYSYSYTNVEVSDVYWEMLKEAERLDILDDLFGDDTISIELVTSSSTKAEYEGKLKNISKLTGTDLSISFADGKMTVRKVGTVELDYIEANGKIYAKVGYRYEEYAKVDGDTVVEDASSDEYVTIEHIWTLAQ